MGERNVMMPRLCRTCLTMLSMTAAEIRLHAETCDGSHEPQWENRGEMGWQEGDREAED